MPSHDFVKTNDILYSDQLTHAAACMHSCIGVLNLTSEDTAAAINDAVLFGRYITYANTVAAYGKDLLKGIKQLHSGVIIGVGKCFYSFKEGTDK